MYVQTNYRLPLPLPVTTTTTTPASQQVIHLPIKVDNHSPMFIKPSLKAFNFSMKIIHSALTECTEITTFSKQKLTFLLFSSFKRTDCWFRDTNGIWPVKMYASIIRPVLFRGRLGTDDIITAVQRHRLRQYRHVLIQYKLEDNL